jgi:queuine tRNA-ribosyltransferase
MNINTYTLDVKDDKARNGVLRLNHGIVETPVFMPVGTYGCVKTLTPHELVDVGAEIILCNTYHIYLRPGCVVVKELGGLSRFIPWDKPILTDSGGFQIYSLTELRNITEEGVIFKSHLNGETIALTPEKSIEIQENIGSDIMMALDECPSSLLDRDYIEKSINLTTKWAKRSFNARKDKSKKLFGIVQGGIHKDLRKQSIQDIVSIDFDGYAIGGLSVGEEKNAMYETANFCCDLLPEDKPRYLMGVGTPEDILIGISYGIDMFDCVMPTRNARNGLLFTTAGRLHIKNKCYERDERPIDGLCNCYTCNNFSRAYLRHIYKIKEMLAYRLNTIHNIYFYISLVKKARDAINGKYYKKFLKETLEEITKGDNNV